VLRVFTGCFISGGMASWEIHTLVRYWRFYPDLNEGLKKSDLFFAFISFVVQHLV